MFQVETDASGTYRISIGGSRVYSTRDIEEIKTALSHYFGVGCRLGSNPNCPLCRAINRRKVELLRNKQEVV